jgi:hypothetical protein
VSDLLEIILRPIFEIVFHLVGYYTGRPIVRLLSFGSLHVDHWVVDRPDAKRRWRPLTYRRGGRTYLDQDAVALTGIVFWFAAVAFYVYVRYYLNPRG